MSYERLTERQDDGTVKYLGGDNDTLATAYEKLKYRLCELEDKIKNGLLVELPCKVGDTVYKVNGGVETCGEIVEGKVSMLYCTSERRWKIRFVYQLPIYKTKSMYDFYWDTACIFTTEEAAEAKLKELRRE